MTTDDSFAGELYLRLIRAISDIRVNHGIFIYAPMGSGKTLSLITGISRFVKRNPDSSILFVTNTLSITRQAEELRAEDVPVIPLRDQAEARNWAYHSPLEERSVLVVADRLFNRSFLAKLQGREFDLMIVDTPRSFPPDAVMVLLSRSSRFVWVNPPSELSEIINVRNKETLAQVGAPDAQYDRTVDTAPHVRRTVVSYRISDAERKLISEGLQYLPHLKGEPAPSARRAAESSRAAFSTALLAMQYRRVAPGAHRLLQRGSHSLSADYPDDPAGESVDRSLSQDETLFPAWGMSPPEYGDQIDALLDRFDDLEEDNKLEVMLSVIQEEIESGRGRGVVIMVQRTVTSDYVRQFLVLRMRGTFVEIAGRHTAPFEDLFSASGIPRVLIVSDQELPYLTEAPDGVMQLWFDPPLSLAHGYRRLEFLGTRRAVACALMADPPFLNEQRHLQPFGFYATMPDY